MPEFAPTPPLRYLEPHIHFEGSLPLRELPAYAKRACIDMGDITRLSSGITIPAPSAAALKGRPKNFSDFIALYVKCSVLLQNQQNMEAATRHFVSATLTQGISEAHVYFSLQTHLLLGADLTSISENLTFAQNLAAEHGLHLAWIFDLIRGVSAFEQETIDFALAGKTHGINTLALGLAGDESRGYAKHYGEIFQQAKQNGLLSIIHAGETQGPDSVRQALDILGADRIGHGLSAITDSCLVAELRERQTIIEVCPACNIALGIFNNNNHPLAAMVEQGLKIVIGSDDPGLINSNLLDNYALAKKLGLEETKLSQAIDNAKSLRLAAPLPSKI